MSGESARNPRSHHTSNSTGDLDGEFGSADFGSYTQDNQPPPVQIALRVADPAAQDYYDTDQLSDEFEQKSIDVRINEDDNLLYKKSKPLTRLVKISPVILSIYRIIVVLRIAFLGLFLYWRVTHPNEDAIWLWGVSVVCEIWFAFSWLLDQITKLRPVNRATDLEVLKAKFETPSQSNPMGKPDLPGIDVFVSTADPEKEPPLVTANTILSILAVDYPVEKLSCYVSDDGGALLTFEAMAEAASFAKIWVPFCRKHEIEPRNPETYFGLKRDPYKEKFRHDFVRERRVMKRKYEEFKVTANALSDSIRQRSDAYNSRVELKLLKKWKESVNGEEESIPPPHVNTQKATWMSDGTHWPGSWAAPAPRHSRSDHTSIIQVLLDPPDDGRPVKGIENEENNNNQLNFSEVDTRLPMFVYVSREKRPGYDHNKKAGAMNALIRASAIMSNGPFILNLNYDHFVYNSRAVREGICFMMGHEGDRVCYVQFPLRFEGIDPSDRYANKKTAFFDINMRALDGIQGPLYLGTGCLFRRTALYGFDPPRLSEERHDRSNCCFTQLKKLNSATVASELEYSDEEEIISLRLIPKIFGSSSMLVGSISIAAYQGKPLGDHPSMKKRGRPPGALTARQKAPINVVTISEAVNVISCWYEDKTEWGTSVGWIYGSVTGDVVTGYQMHNKGWRSVYCSLDAFRGTAPINLTDRLQQVLRWATGSVEIFFSRNNAVFAGPRLKFLQRIAYLNVGTYPFTGVFLLLYCFLPPLSLFSGQFIVQIMNVTFLIYLLIISLSLCALAVLEIKWSGIALEEWWRNEQFWLIGGTSAHLVAVIRGILKVVTGVEISFTLTSKSAGDDEDDDFPDLYVIKWTSLMIPPLTIVILNVIAVLFGVCRAIYSDNPQWNKLIGGVLLAMWVLLHLYPFVKGLMGRRGRTPTIIYVWSGLIAICFSLIYISISPPSGNSDIGGSFQFR